MNSVASKGENNRVRIFETVLSSPGMSEKCKVVLQLSRQHILLLARLLEAGLLPQNEALGDEVLAALPKERLEELREVHVELLSKSDLSDFYARLKQL